MVAQVIVDIGNQHVEDDAPIEGMSVGLPLRTMLRKSVNDLRVATALTVLGTHHRHCR